jgi:hypothetical protein
MVSSGLPPGMVWKVFSFYIIYILYIYTYIYIYVVEGVVISSARSHIVAITEAGRAVAHELDHARKAIGGVGGGATGEDTEVMLASRTCADDLWILRVSSDTTGATFYLHTPYMGTTPRKLLSARPQAHNKKILKRPIYSGLIQ